MKPRLTKRRISLRIADCLGAVLALGLIVVLSATGLGPVPALAAVLTPGTGVWHLSPDAGTATSGTLTLPGLQQPGTVAFEPDGATHITAATDQDLFRMTGYVDARFRLVQMDLERRQAESKLAAVIGQNGLSSDEFEDNLGVMRTADRDWTQMGPNDPARIALESYSQGVNAAIDQLKAAHQLPTEFKLLGYTPAPWTPLDSLGIQVLMTQTLSYSDSALPASYLAKAFPANVFNALYPVVADNPQTPYDPGPYKKLPLSPLPVMVDPGPSGPSGGAAPGPQAAGSGGPFGQLISRVAALPVNAQHYIGNSNAWAISGSKTASGQPILAGDPHLQLTLPSDWYQLEATSPSYHFTGVQLPGIPLPIIAKTNSISWSVTSSEHPVTLYYVEKTSASRPGQYYYNGSWRTMRTENYTIDVKGKHPVNYQVAFAAQGPVMQDQGYTAAVWWAGSLPSDDIDSMLKVMVSTSFIQFKDALKGWLAPALNFVYADNKGNIGVIDAGIAPQVPGHNISLPLPGDGSADVAGSIPYAALPTAYNPPDGYIASANNREVGASYPYEFSTSYNFADAGYRAQEIVEQLSKPGQQTPQMQQQLQASLTDSLAQGLVPQVIKAMEGQPMTAEQRQFLSLLSSWNGWMGTNSPQAFFFQKYLGVATYAAFGPWFKYYKVPDGWPQAPLALKPTGENFSSSILASDLEAWAQTDPDNPLFSLPDGTSRDAADVLRTAYTETISMLTKSYGTDFANWDYGKHNSRIFPSLLSVPGFNYGPIEADGDSRTISPAVPILAPGPAEGPTEGTTLVNNNKTSVPTGVVTAGASFRFVVNWGTGATTGVLPGGDSENPISPWYSNGITQWLKGEQQPLLEGPAAEKAATIKWRFTS